MTSRNFALKLNLSLLIKWIFYLHLHAHRHKITHSPSPYFHDVIYNNPLEEWWETIVLPNLF